MKMPLFAFGCSSLAEIRNAAFCFWLFAIGWKTKSKRCQNAAFAFCFSPFAKIQIQKMPKKIFSIELDFSRVNKK